MIQPRFISVRNLRRAGLYCKVSLFSLNILSHIDFIRYGLTTYKTCWFCNGHCYRHYRLFLWLRPPSLPRKCCSMQACRYSSNTVAGVATAVPCATRNLRNIRVKISFAPSGNQAYVNIKLTQCTQRSTDLSILLNVLRYLQNVYL